MVIKKHQEKDAKHSKSTLKREPLRSSSSSHAKKDDKPVKESSVEKSTNSNQIQILIGAAVVGLLVIVLVIVIMLSLTSNGNTEVGGDDAMIPEIEIENPVVVDENINSQDDFNPLAPVLNINGEEILAQDILIVQMQLESQGFQVTQEQALEQIITNTVLLQAVQEQNFEISNEEAEEELIRLLATQGFTIEDLKSDLEEQGLSYEATLQDFKERIAVDKFLSQNIDSDTAQVTSEEVGEFYSMLSMQMGGDVPPFEEIELQIIAQIEQDKLRELQQQLIDRLIEEAEIEFY